MERERFTKPESGRLYRLQSTKMLRYLTQPVTMGLEKGSPGWEGYLEELERAADRTGVKILGADMFRFAVNRGY